jgi:hypothetical protein
MLIKYKLYKNNEFYKVSYSQLVDSQGNQIHDTKRSKIKEDLSFYRNSALRYNKQDKYRVDIFINNELYRTVKI